VNESRQRCVILGGGGHGRMVLDCLIAGGEVEVAGFLDPDGNRGSDGFHGLEVLGSDELLPELRDRGIVGFAVGLGAVSADGRRRDLFDRACWEGMAPVTVRHPSALLAPSSSIGVGCQLMPRAVVNSGARLGVHVLVNTAAIVEHDCRVADHAHVASGAVLGGGVQIGDGALVGAGAFLFYRQAKGNTIAGLDLSPNTQGLSLAMPPADFGSSPAFFLARQ